MPSDEGTEFVVVDLGPTATPDPRVAFADAVRMEPHRGDLERRFGRWWTAASVTSRGVLLAAVSLTALAVGALVVGAAGNRTQHAVTHVAVDPARPPGVNALGCPVDRSCDVRWPVAAADFIVRIHPHLSVIGYETFDRHTGVTYRRDLVATSARPAAVLRVVAQCVPNGPRIFDKEGGLVNLQRDGRRTSAAVQIMRFDLNGCSVWASSSEELGPAGRPYQTEPDTIDDLVDSPYVRIGAQ